MRAQWQVREVQHRQQPGLGREAGTCDSSKHWGRLIGSRLAKRANSVQFYVGAVLYALSFPGVPAFFFCVCVRFLGERGMGFSKCSDLETRKVREETRNPKPLSHGRFGNRWVTPRAPSELPRGRKVSSPFLIGIRGMAGELFSCCERRTETFSFPKALLGVFLPRS